MGEHKHGVTERAKKRKQKNLIYGIIGVALVIVLIAVIAVFGGKLHDKVDDGTEPTELVVVPAKIGEIDETGHEVIADTEVEQSEFHIGDIVKYGGTKLVLVSSHDNVHDMVVEDGYKVIALQFAVENIGKRTLDVSFYNFSCFADKKPAVMEYGGSDCLDAELSSGRFADGYIYFKVPVDAKTIEIQYVGDIQDEELPIIKFIYDGVKTTGFVGKSNVVATDGALSVGSVVELNNRKVTYLGCSVYTNVDDEIQPRDGYQFISCEFLIENISDTYKLDITSWDFSCYADDKPYKIVHHGDNDINKVVPIGESVQGTVTFEVPIGAKIIELEYLYDYLTLDRAIFSVELPIE